MGRSTMKAWLLVGLLLATAGYVIAEEITLTTYYPSPRGVYQELRSTSSSYFATGGGSVGIGTDALNAAARFQVKGNTVVQDGQFQLGGLPADPPALGSGAMYFNTTDNEAKIFQSGAWQRFGGGGGVKVGSGAAVSGGTINPLPGFTRASCAVIVAPNGCPYLIGGHNIPAAGWSSTCNWSLTPQAGGGGWTYSGSQGGAYLMICQ
ncbi:MAG: hypothetical protein HY737_09160 [Candidatus Omnitrophica bacterium]|nr:hypothetical protein [Candidatus Omnitrophota bacterium]